MNPLELLQIAAPSNADGGFDLFNTVRRPARAVLVVGREGRLDACAPLDGTAVLAADQVVGKQSGTGHRRSQRGDGDTLEQRRLSRTVPSEHQVHVREVRIPGTGSRRPVRMEEPDSRSPERPEIAHGDRIDVHRACSTIGTEAGRYHASRECSWQGSSRDGLGAPGRTTVYDRPDAARGVQAAVGPKPVTVAAPTYWSKRIFRFAVTGRGSPCASAEHRQPPAAVSFAQLRAPPLTRCRASSPRRACRRPPRAPRAGSRRPRRRRGRCGAASGRWCLVR